MLDNEKSPLITVAIPVYNESKYLKNSLDSILNQDYKNIEIIISDNASTDDTAAICLEYAEKDKRIQYSRHEENIGAANNFFSLASKAHGAYFMWAAGHDKWSSNLISECLKLFNKLPDATVAYGTPVWIGENGKQINRNAGWYDTRGCNVFSRFYTTFWGSMNPVLGVIRRDKLPDLTRDYNFIGTDLVILADLALRGEFVHAPAATFYRRQNRPAENYQDKLERYKSKESQIAQTFLSGLFPLARLPFELLRTLLLAKISLLDKILILSMLIPSMPIKYILGKKDNKRAL